MEIISERKLNYDDVLLVPQFSDAKTRSTINIQGSITPNISLDIPVIVANMDTVVNQEVIAQAAELGSAGIFHRYEEPEWTLRSIRELDFNHISPIIPSIGAGESQVDLAIAYIKTKKIHALCIDIAHGDSRVMLDTLKGIRKYDKNIPIIAGNVATEKGAMRLMDEGANSIKVGIGPGFVCTTRKQTGCGYPQLSAIIEIAPNVHARGGTVIADGGIRSSGDCVKALAAGADSVMSGYLFAGSKESGKETYRGMASFEAQNNFKGSAKNIEGMCTTIESKGPIKNILQAIKEGIQSGFSYCGANNINELRSKAKFVIIK